MSVSLRREQPQATTYSKRLKDSIKSILDNYGEMLKASKVASPTPFNLQEKEHEERLKGVAIYMYKLLLFIRE